MTWPSTATQPVQPPLPFADSLRELHLRRGALELPVCHTESRLHLRLCILPVPPVSRPHRNLDHTGSHTPAALSSSFSFSHTPRPSGRGGGTGLLLSPSWSFSVLPLSDISITSFEYHSVLINHPINLYIIVVYRPPGPLGCFLDELDTLLSSFPEDGTPLILLGDFNIHLDASQSAAFLPLLRSFDLTLQPSPPTHKAGNLLDLVFQRNS
ncbi:hypothetical protein SKAU_G00020790, partial [Synaphobranchus kaupii]